MTSRRCLTCGRCYAPRMGSLYCGSACRRADVTPFDALPVSCWCEATTVLVSRLDLRAGLTRTCGRIECTEGVA